MIRQAAILAGGRGTRLGPLTREVPKPMAPVAGVPYLEHQLRLLARQSIRDIVLLTGYLGGQIEEYFGDGSRLGLRVRYSREPRPAGTGGALRDARALLDPAFLLLYGDSYLPIEYSPLAARLEESGALAVVAVFLDTAGVTAVAPNLAVDPAGFVTRYDKTAANDPELRYIEAGVLALRRAVLDLLPPEGEASLEQQTFPLLIRRRALAAAVTTQRFYDIGTPERLRTFEEFLA